MPAKGGCLSLEARQKISNRLKEFEKN